MIPVRRIAWCRIAALMAVGILASNSRGDDSTSYGEPIELTDQARKLHDASLVVDGHNDMPWEIRDQGSGSFDKLDIAEPQPSLQTDIPRLREGGVGAQFWSVWVPVSFGYRGTALGETIEQIKLVKAMIARYPNDFELALTTGDMTRIHEQGRIASLIGVEGGHCIEESLSNLDNFYGLGARYMTLTHSDTLSWADSGTDDHRNDGLTDFGVRVVETMNRLGMMVDLSHVSAATMHDTLDVSKAPIIFSHSSARAIADSPRNVPDDVLRRLREQDGVVMVNFFSGFVVPEAIENYKEYFALRKKLEAELGERAAKRQLIRWRNENPMPRGTIHHVLDHIDHITKIAGADHVGLGSDYDGVTTLPTQLDDVSSYPYITQGLLDRGYSDEEIRGILGGNLMRVMRRTEQVAATLQDQSTTP
jgi:membrane dipeptidase